MMSKALAASKKVYRCVEPAELEKIAGTVHHGGIVAVVSAPAFERPTDAEIGRWAAHRAPLLLLDRIGNPHNLGAIARTAGFFGVEHLIVQEGPEAAAPSDAAYRVAEGALEQVHVHRVPSLVAFVRQLTKAGYEVVGAATRGGRADVGQAGSKPVALVLGNEEHGLSPDVEAACSRRVTIHGAGLIESLNVSAAGAILLWELVGRVRTPRTR